MPGHHKTSTSQAATSKEWGRSVWERLRQKEKMKETGREFEGEAEAQRYIFPLLVSFDRQLRRVGASVIFRMMVLRPRRRSRALWIL